jgi:hypothetical protein
MKYEHNSHGGKLKTINRSHNENMFFLFSPFPILDTIYFAKLPFVISRVIFHYFKFALSSELLTGRMQILTASSLPCDTNMIDKDGVA